MHLFRASSVSLEIWFLLCTNLLFSIFKFLNLFYKSSIFSKPDLSSTTDYKKKLNYLCLSKSSFFSLDSFSLSSNILWSSSNSFLRLSISNYSLLIFSSSFFLFTENAWRSTVLEVTSSIIYYWFCLYFWRSASNSRARPIISSFCTIKFESVSLSSLSF